MVTKRIQPKFLSPDKNWFDLLEPEVRQAVLGPSEIAIESMEPCPLCSGYMGWLGSPPKGYQGPLVTVEGIPWPFVFHCRICDPPVARAHFLRDKPQKRVVWRKA